MKFLRELIFPLAAIAAAFVVGGIVVALIGDDPMATYRLLIGSALSWPDGIGYTLFYATPLIFTGLAVAVGFRCGLLNIGAEGQLTIAAFATAWAGITFANAPFWILIPLTCAVAILSGAAWAAIPGILKARFGSHEVINTIMMNFIAAGVASALTQSYFERRGIRFSRRFPSRRRRTSHVSVRSCREFLYGSRSTSHLFWRWPPASSSTSFCGARSGVTKFARQVRIRALRNTVVFR